MKVPSLIAAPAISSITPMPKVTTELLSAIEQPAEEAQAQLHRGGAVVEPGQVGGHVLLGAGDLDRLDGAEHLAQEAADGVGGHAARLVVGQDAPPGQAGEKDNPDQRQEDHQGDGQVDRAP